MSSDLVCYRVFLQNTMCITQLAARPAQAGAREGISPASRQSCASSRRCHLLPEARGDFSSHPLISPAEPLRLRAVGLIMARPVHLFLGAHSCVYIFQKRRTTCHGSLLL